MIVNLLSGHYFVTLFSQTRTIPFCPPLVEIFSVLYSCRIVKAFDVSDGLIDEQTNKQNNHPADQTTNRYWIN
jgi:hypothetical protein